MRDQDITCANGIFGADMQLALVNDGPVTIWFDTCPRPSPLPKYPRGEATPAGRGLGGGKPPGPALRPSPRAG
ncbi:MAG: D-aminoacyl-tRNA deacylase [Pseudorhodobacter sp.]|nr:D-aminoacyl-tRNA deacylase [Pseudorhodobacter sp.]